MSDVERPVSVPCPADCGVPSVHVHVRGERVVPLLPYGPGAWRVPDVVLGLRSVAGMLAVPAETPIHPAGVGSAAEFMTRLLLANMPDDWRTLVADRWWLASAPDRDDPRSVQVCAEPDRTGWSVNGCRPGDPVGLALPGWGFTPAAADAVVALLRVLDVLPPAGD